MRGLLPLLAVLAFAIGVSFVDRTPSPLSAALPVTAPQTALEPPTPGRRKGQGHHEPSAPKEHQEGQDAERTAKAGPAPRVRQDTPPHHDGVGPEAEGEGQWYARPDWWIAGLTGLLAFMTGALWWVTWGMWDVTRKAVIHGEKAVATAMSHVTESAKAAAAMDRLANTSAETAKRQLRAYVLVQEAHIEQLAVGQIPTAVVRVKNFGQTPAHEVVVASYIGFGPYPLGEFPQWGDVDALSQRTLGPGDNFLTLTPWNSVLNFEEIQAITKGSNAFYVIGITRYVDVFDVKQTTEFCMFAGGGQTNLDGFLAAYHDGNKAT